MASSVQGDSVANQPLLEASVWRDRKSSYESHEAANISGRSDDNRKHFSKWLVCGLLIPYAPLIILCITFYTKLVTQSYVARARLDLFPCKSDEALILTDSPNNSSILLM